MEQTTAVVDLVSIYRNTDRAQSRIKDLREKLAAYDADANRKTRVDCRVCAYIDNARIGGSAMTTRPCGLCKVEIRYGNTCTDVLCEECAKANQICRHCGGDIDCKQRRKRGQPVAAPTGVLK